jgi:hypothetical protein
LEYLPSSGRAFGFIPLAGPFLRRQGAGFASLTGGRMFVGIILGGFLIAMAATQVACRHLDGPTIHFGTPADPRLNPQSQF